MSTERNENMNWPGQSPEQLTPSPSNPAPPEGTPAPKGFRVRVENPDLILQAAQKGVSGEIGVTLMSDPLKDIEVKLESQGESFNLLGSVTTTFEAWSHRGYNPDSVRATVAQRCGEVIERGGAYIITGPRGAKFTLSESTVGRNDMCLSTGVVHRTLDKVQVSPAPQSNKETFDVTLADFADLLKIVVEEGYKADKKSTPDEELVLHPPKQPMAPEGRPGLGGIFGNIGETTTPQELLGKLQIEKPNVSFEDIGGNQKAKREIESLAFALKNPELYKKWGTRPPKGIVLYGPPGTGKTLMAKALAAQADASFFHVEAADIVSKWYGESTKIVKSIFDLANKNPGKTIIFFDEVDAIAPHREGAHEASQRIVGAMLENMDGMASNENVMVVASTNRLEGIEPALLRAGRFDRWVEVPVPDEEGRKQIFGIHTAKVEQVAGRKLFENVSVEAVAAKTEKLSGADLAEIVRRVLEEKVRQEGTTGQEPGPVTTDDVLKELGEYERVMKAKRSIGFATSHGK